MRHAPEAQPVKLGEVTRKPKILAVSGDGDVMVRVRLAQPLMGLVRVVASELLVVNGIGQLSGLSTLPLRTMYNRLVDPMVSRITTQDPCRMSLAGYCPFEKRSIIPGGIYMGSSRCGGASVMHIHSDPDQGS
jgi:hypothetical protein